MQNISSDLLTKKQGFPVVEVLLATFNGESFLSEFLESLCRQEGVRIHLCVSDDGSTDDTLAILESYRHRFESYLIFRGPRKGPSENFLSLLSRSSQDYVAFADQDDIWLPRHLVHSISRLRSQTDCPAMTFSQVLEWDNQKSLNELWPLKVPQNSLKMYFAQNFARGCTIVLNKALVDLIKSERPQKLIMHDWWAFLVGATCGKAIFESNPEVIYRLHSNNFIGSSKKKSLLRLYITNRSTRTWAPLDQLIELRLLYESNFSQIARVEVDEFIEGFTGNFFQRLRFATKISTKLRLEMTDQFKVRLGIVLFPFFFGKN